MVAFDTQLPAARAVPSCIQVDDNDEASSHWPPSHCQLGPPRCECAGVVCIALTCPGQWTPLRCAASRPGVTHSGWHTVSHSVTECRERRAVIRYNTWVAV
eukprot:2831661-Rhodomonas_salina.1